MKDSEIYRRAAELIATNKERFCCFAIGLCGGTCLEFTMLMRDNRRYLWMQEENEHSWQEPVRNRRVLALCLMAAICEEEGR